MIPLGRLSDQIGKTEGYGKVVEENDGASVFPNINDMVRGLGFDLKDWVNTESARFLRKRVYDQTEQRVQYYPAHLLEALKFVCPSGHEVLPSWLEKRTPLLPFRSREGALWRPSTGSVKCQTCSIHFEIELPNVPNWQGEVLLYGDEAFRDIDPEQGEPRYCVTYSLVSRPINEKDDHELAKAFADLKLNHFGNINKIHCKELFHAKNGKGPTTEQASSFIREVADLMAGQQGKIVILNSTGVTYKPAHFKKQEIEIRKSQIFGTLILMAIENLTKHGRSPRFFFERTDSDGWAKNLFNGGRLTLMWPFVTHGLPIRTPEFVPPTSSMYLELADIVSFAVADNIRHRAMEREGKNAPSRPRLDLCRLGPVQYQGFLQNGDALSQTCVGYPWSTFFAGTSWA